MKTFKLLLLGLLATALSAGAVPARRGLFTYTQPDGTTIKASIVGDENAHYYLSDDKLPMLRDADGFFRYAVTAADGQITLSEIKACNSAERSEQARELTAKIDTETFSKAFAAKARASKIRRSRAQAISQQGLGLFTGNYPRTGTIRALVMLVEYSDVKFTLEDPVDYFSRLFNEEGFCDYNGTGSVRDYFMEQSSGKFDIHYDVLGPVPLSGKRSYYGTNNSYGDDIYPEQMAIEAVEYLKDNIDYSRYDYDNDGNIDNIFIVYAGEGEADGGPDETVWPHASEIINGKTYNGKTLFGYCCVNEWQHYSDRPAPIGTFVHEFSHVMGLPDLYNTYNSNATYTPGTWTVLDYGTYNNDGCTPPSYGAFERNAMGWLSPRVLTRPDHIVLEDIQKSNDCCLIETEKTNEFFLLENRQQTGWDKYLPEHGMLIWHIDFVQRIWDSNSVNNTQSHQYVDIEEASGLANNFSDASMSRYTFPGPTDNTSFTAETSPALVSWSGKSIDLPITGIDEVNSTITFDVAGGIAPDAPELSAGTDGSILIKWNKIEYADGYLLNIFTRVNGTIKPHRIYTDYKTGNTDSFTATGMDSETEYFVTIRATMGRNTSAMSPESSIITPELDFIYCRPLANSGTADNCNNILLSWNHLKGAINYILSVEKATFEGTTTHTVDFGTEQSTITLPEGWSWSGSLSNCYDNSSTRFYGNAAPALKLNADDATLTSPLFNSHIKNIALWTRGASNKTGNTVYIEGHNGDVWQIIDSYAPVDYYGYGSTLSFSPEARHRQFRIRYSRPYAGNVALDDIEVTIANTSYPTIADLQNIITGNINSYTISLPAETESIRFSVIAVDANGRHSLASEPATIIINDNTGISDMIAPDSGTTAEYYNLQGIRITNPGNGIYIRRTGSRIEKVLVP